MSDTPLFDRDLFDGLKPRLVREFEAFHRDNPQVYALFVRFALQAAGRRSHFGAKAVFERMRWHAAFDVTGDEFKVNNNYTAFYARLFERDYPQHAGFFRQRASVADGVA